MHRLQELVLLHRRGHTAAEVAEVAEVAETLQLAPKTERKYRRRIQAAGLLIGDPDDLPNLAALRTAVSLPSTVPPQEQSSVAAHALLCEEKRAFTGSLSAVKRLYKRLKQAGGPRAEDVAIPVHTRPGRQAQVDLLVIDDFALRTMTAAETMDMHEIVSGRHRRASMIVTSNRTPEEWLDQLPDRLHAQALVDRFQNNAFDLVIDGESYRRRQKPQLSSAE